MRITALFTARWRTATGTLPGDQAFWQAALDDTDRFAYETAQAGKGGPFGASLWLVQPKTKKYIYVGTDSNAVVSKGIASAHAEAENLSAENQDKIMEFLRNNQGQGWHVVQLSSGESCQSCRAKQVLFALALTEEKLIAPGAFHVAYKASYQQTMRDAGFNDAPYDMTFRAIGALRLPESTDGLFGLEKALAGSKTTKRLAEKGQLIYVPVRRADPMSSVRGLDAYGRMRIAGQQRRPYAFLVDKQGAVIGEADQGPTNIGDQLPIIRALHRAAILKRAQGVFESWNLQEATLVTNIRDIGPLSYAETLWYNIDHIDVIDDPIYAGLQQNAREHPAISNRQLFSKVAAEYDASACPLAVRYMGDPEQSSIAHQFWRAHQGREALLRAQASRLPTLAAGKVDVSSIDTGQAIPIEALFAADGRNSHYDGKQAEPLPRQQPVPAA